MKQYHRCVFDNDEEYEGILFLFAPLVILISLYLLLIAVIIKNKIKVTKVIITTGSIILTGMLVCIPEILMVTFNVKMSYEAAQVLTVTLYYMNSVFNPVIYFCVNPRVSQQISISRSVRQMSFSMSSENFNLSKVRRITFGRMESTTLSSKTVEEVQSAGSHGFDDIGEK